MEPGKRVLYLLTLLLVVFMQVVMSQVVTFLFSFLFPGGSEAFPQEHPVQFILFLSITYTLGVFLTGWAVLKLGWLRSAHLFLPRLLAAWAGAFLPLAAALAASGTLKPGNPGFTIAIFTCILGFYLPGWVRSGERRAVFGER